MCIAINSPKGTSPTKNALENSFDYNPDGAGYCFANDGKLIIRKGFFDFDSFLKSYQNDNIQGFNKLIHFRISTSGKVNKLNCHPFLITENVAMIHNGIIPNFGNKVENDTLQYIKLVLKPIIKEGGVKVLLNPSIQNLIIDSIGHSKLAFLDNNGNSYIINENFGHRFNSIWYSNDSYLDCDSIDNYNYGFKIDSSNPYTDPALTCQQCFNDLVNDEYELCDSCDNMDLDGYNNPVQRITKWLD